MHPASWLVALLGVAGLFAADGCSSDAAPSRKATKDAPGTAGSAVRGPAEAKIDAPAITIESFDCYKLHSGPPADFSGPGVSAWRGGGPGGATWNAVELNCKAVIQTTCTDGSVVTETRIGKALVDRKTTAVRGTTVDWRLTLQPHQWEKNFDEVPSPNRAAYRTALFRLAALLTCKAPYALQPSLGPRPEFAADRTFLAGFASGE
jgi:hypothetical protein